MKTIDYCEKYFEQYGLIMLKDQFADYLDSIAAGVAGAGSDCFGFDDSVSEDHDSGIGFSIWVDKEVYEKIGFDLARAYARLPGEFEGKTKGKVLPYGENHFGVKTVEGFFQSCIGLPGAPITYAQWLNIPDYAFAQAVNGKVFYDPSGYFSSIRKEIIEGMPQDVRLKKMSLRAVECAQSGQYNFLRCVKHGEYAAAGIYISDFAKSYISLAFILNNGYAPYQKWMFKALNNLPGYSDIYTSLTQLLTLPNDKTTAEYKFEIIETLCRHIADIFRTMNISESKDNYLEKHAYEIRDKIKNTKIRQLHIMEGNL
ncbi:MAG: DUF4037 domain-containing protein [Clostridiales bacterium]|nr:DUF4037 domain-containing protein [Clostridiales bacterium]